MEAEKIGALIKNLDVHDIESTCLLIAASTPLICFLSDKLADLASELMSNGYSLHLKTNHIECDLTKGAA